MGGGRGRGFRPGGWENREEGREGSPFGGRGRFREEFGGRFDGFRGGRGGGPAAVEQSPTQPPACLAVPHDKRTNDVEIIVINRAITEYGEMIEGRLKAVGFSVDLLFPNEEVPLPRVLANIASRGTLYAVLVTPVHQQHRSLTLNILHGSPQEHRNMPMDDAVTYISRNYEMYVMQCGERRGTGPPEDVRALADQLIRGRPLSPPQLDKLILFLTQEKAKIGGENGGQPASLGAPLAPGQVKGGASSLQETELQNRILNILNKGAGGTSPAPAPPPQNKPPLLSDPTVQKALDSLMQGDIFKQIPPGRGPPPRRF